MLSYILATFFSKKKAHNKPMTIVGEPREIISIRRRANRQSLPNAQHSSLFNYFNNLRGLNTLERINYLKH